MLVLTGSENERIAIWEASAPDTPIWITIVRADAKVRLGIEAPPEVHVDREAVYRSKVASAA